MVGLFSNLHLMMEKDINYVVENLPVNIEIKKALIGKRNILRDILELALAYEVLDNKKIEEQCTNLKIDEGVLVDVYYSSIEWCKNIGN